MRGRETHPKLVREKERRCAGAGGKRSDHFTQREPAGDGVAEALR